MIAAAKLKEITTDYFTANLNRTWCTLGTKQALCTKMTLPTSKIPKIALLLN